MKSKKKREQEKDKIERRVRGIFRLFTHDWLHVCVCVKILLVCSIVCFGHSFLRFVILEHFSFLKTSAVNTVTVSICLFMADPFFVSNWLHFAIFVFVRTYKRFLNSKLRSKANILHSIK